MSEKFSSFFKKSSQSPEDLEFWKKFLQDVKPSKSSENKVLAPQEKPLPPFLTKADRDVALPSPLSAALVPTNKRRRQIRRVEVDARLDLHGLTQQEAMNVLSRFIKKCFSERCSCLLIITGKGRPAPGILRNLVLCALAQPHLKPMISDLTEASAKDGGSGAFYVFLKKG